MYINYTYALFYNGKSFFLNTTCPTLKQILDIIANEQKDKTILIVSRFKIQPLSVPCCEPILNNVNIVKNRNGSKPLI
jgi:hypothetical protein